MKRITLTGPREVVIEDAPVPEPHNGQILVHVRRSAISAGTELTYYRGVEGLRLARDEYMYPIRPGYAAVGIVESCGGDVSNLRPGDRVVCLAPHAEYALADAALAVVVPPELDDDRATGAILTVTTMHAVRRAEILYGGSVVVIGAGVVGLLAGLQARLAGASLVAVVDMDTWRLGIAKMLGLHAVDATLGSAETELNGLTDGLGPDVVIEAAGTPAAFSDALRFVRDGGRVVTLGYHVTPVSFVPGEEYFFKELELRASRAMGPDPGSPAPLMRWTSDRSLQAAINLHATGRLDMAPMITHRVPFSEVPSVYEMLDRRTSPALHVVLEWS